MIDLLVASTIMRSKFKINYLNLVLVTNKLIMRSQP